MEQLLPEAEAPDSRVRPKPPTGQELSEQLLIPIEDIFHALRVEAEWLRRNMFSTLAVASGQTKGVGARRYSKVKLAGEVQRMRGMTAFVHELIRDRVPGGGIPDGIYAELSSKTREASYVAQGRNPDGTERGE